MLAETVRDALLASGLGLAVVVALLQQTIP